MDEKEPSDALVEDPEAVAEPFIENPEAKSRETYYQIDCRGDKTAGEVEAVLEVVAEEVDEAILEADAEEANEVVAEEVDEVILEADAEKADEAIELVVEARLEAAREIFRNKAASRHTIVFRPS